MNLKEAAEISNKALKNYCDVLEKEDSEVLKELPFVVKDHDPAWLACGITVVIKDIIQP